MAREIDREREYTKLEGTYQITRVKNLEKLAYSSQAGAIVGIFLLFVFLGGGQIKPFYLPLFFPLLVILVWLLVIAIQSFIFRLMEIKYRKSKSAKFLMAHRSMKRSYVIVVIAIIVFMITILPFIPQEVENYTSKSGEIRLESEEAVYFPCRGRFDFVRPEYIRVEIVEGENGSIPQDIEVEVFILSREDYLDNDTEMCLNRGLNDPKRATSNAQFYFELPTLQFEEYELLLRTDTPVDVHYEIETTLPQERIYPFSVISIAFLVSYSVWVYTLYPIKDKYSEEGIYR